MKVSVGLPTHLPGVTREDLLAWARRAEELGFASIVVTDRFAWDQLEPLTVLAAAAAVTERVMLRTSVVLLPNRGASGPLAKQLATLQHLAAGRLELGVGVGDRAVDYTLADGSHRGRHRRLEVMLTEMIDIWAGTGEYEVVGPRLTGPIPILLGGTGVKSAERVARYGDGWTFAVGSPDDFARGVLHVREAWRADGRDGRPRLTAQRYVNVGAQNRASSEAFLRQYFGFLGPAVDHLVAATPLDAERAVLVADAFRAREADELTFLPLSTDIGELDRLAELML
ncbi:LLM class flavin-dependent oxidoreductase [Nocardia sp. NPDC050378]|uniref:LLM class flavin-dependent oxidoreductase n=1 Tax=Nocardia sp. NPDC050378 TaxID=3155400 RepID=UPI0033F044FE